MLDNVYYSFCQIDENVLKVCAVYELHEARKEKIVVVKICFEFLNMRIY